MGDDGSRLTTTDREHLLSVPQGPHDPNKSSSSESYSSHESCKFGPWRKASFSFPFPGTWPGFDVSVRHRRPHVIPQAFHGVLRSWASKKFMSGCVILLPITITFYVTWWFVKFVDGFFSPLYAQLGIHIFGLGFVTSIMFIFVVGIFFSSWMGASILSIGEWFIRKMPLVRHIYSASKQISAAISPVPSENLTEYPWALENVVLLQQGVLQTRCGSSGNIQKVSDQNSRAFKEVAIIRHPRAGEYVFGFITSALTLQTATSEEELCSVYIPTNHLYLGDIFLVSSKDIIRPNISVREGIEIVVSGGMTMPTVILPKQE